MSDAYAVMIDKLHTLTGAPLVVLLAAGRAPDFGQAANPAWMEMVTGLSDKTITRAAALLEAQQLIARRGPGWQITAEGQGVIGLLAGAPEADPLPAPARAPEPEKAPESREAPAPKAPSTKKGKAPRKAAAAKRARPPKKERALANQRGAISPAGGPARNFSGEDIHVSSSSSGSSSDSLNQETIFKESLPPPGFQPPESEKKPENPFFSQNLTALKECRIYEPKRSRLARLPHVTPELVRGHYQQTGRNNRLTIFRVESGWELEPETEDPFARTLQILAELPQPEEPPPLPDWAEPAWEAALEQLSKALRPVDFHTYVKSLRLLDAWAEGERREWTAATGNQPALDRLTELGAAALLEAALPGPENHVSLLVEG